MNNLVRYRPFFAASVLLCLVLFIIYPHYQYFIDPDGVSYLAISKRYASGDLLKAINGYWSPWSCWLTAVLISQGLHPIPASVVINTFGAIGVIAISQSYFLKFNIGRQLQWLFCGTLSLFLCYAVFWQSFDDLWECFFLLCALRLILADDFELKPQLWIATGAVGALAYFAKAYAFPFFIFNIICCTYFIAGRTNKALWLKICGVSIFILLLISIPWIVALHEKYGIWTTSTAGSLNMSWYLVGHPQWKTGLGALLPPPYPDSPCYWEDPYLVNGPTPHFWNSWHLLGLQFLRLGLNMWKLLVSMLQLSVFFPLLALAGLSSFRLKRSNVIFAGKSRLMILSFLLFPLGYALINFESRYLWYMVPLAMVMAGMILPTIGRQSLKKALMLIIPASFLIYPGLTMKKIYNAGADEYRVAHDLHNMNMQGTFTAKALPGITGQRMQRLAYFAQMPYYSMPDTSISDNALMAELMRYRINYFLVYSGNEADLGKDMKNEKGALYPSISKEVKDVSLKLKIITVNPNWKMLEGSYY